MIRDVLNNSRILFFSVQTFNLEKEIKIKLENLGATVDYYDERPSNNNFAKGIIRIKRDVYQARIDKYYREILLKTQNVKYDFLFVNRGEVVPAFFLEQFRAQHKETKFIFYTWDSFANHSHPTSILKYFDKKFTFDSDDAVKYGIGFRPLFYLDTYKEIKNTRIEKYSYDLLFLGTAHSDRYRISNYVVNWCNKNNLKSFCYYYMQGKLVYFYKRIFDKSFKEFDYKKLSFTSLSTIEILNLYKQSNVILDINHPGQKGLTMRTFETIGACKKMITTNKEIVKYPFYNTSNICVIDRNKIDIPKDFFDKPYVNIDADLYKKCSIEGWIESLFVGEETGYWIKNIN